MEPRPGCDEILLARSSASEDDDGKVEASVPGDGRVLGQELAGSIGRRGFRRDIERDCEKGVILCVDSVR